MMRASVVLALIAALACRCEASISIADVVAADIAAGNLDHYTQNGAGRHLMAGLIPGLNISELNIPKQTRGFGDVITTQGPAAPVTSNARVAQVGTSTGDASSLFPVDANDRTAAVALPAVPPQLTICSDGIHICSGSTPIQLRGVNWFGFESGATLPDGLWQGPTSLTLDFITVLRRIKLLGYNTIRLPMSLQQLYRGLPIDRTANCPYSGTNPTAAQILASTVRPGVTTSGGSIDLAYTPPGAIPTDGSAAVCNNYIPSTTILARYLWVVAVLARNNFVVVIDNHLNTDTTFITNQTQWNVWYMDLVDQINKDNYSKTRVIWDILNEPDSQGLRWEAANGKPSMTTTYLNWMAAVYAKYPNSLYAIEGLGQTSLGTNWGDGLATNPAYLTGTSASDPSPFFQQLMTKPFKNKVIAMPHFYFPSISLNTNQAMSTAPGFYTRLTNSFGYLNKAGYCYNNACIKLPIVIGEFGGYLRDCRNRCASANPNCMALELNEMNLFLNYMNAAGAGNDGGHNAIDSWIWWSWNANSGDTGGVVEDDWATPVEEKISYMGMLGLRPWYYSFCSAVGCFDTLSTTPPGCASCASQCTTGTTCNNGQCCANANVCGDACCANGTPCTAGICCPPTRSCNGICCPTGQTCSAGKCAATGDAGKQCGTKSCPTNVACNGNACCSAAASCGPGRNSVCCAGSGVCKLYTNGGVACCPAAQTCGSYCCRAGTETCTGATCCPVAQACGTKCCPTGQVCSGGVCTAPRELATKTCGTATCATSVACNGNACCSAAASCGPGLNSVCCAGDGTCRKYTTSGGMACCPAAQTCGNYCCRAGTETCTGATCCPVARACGTKCCAAGDSCVNGVCKAPKTCGTTTCPATVACNGSSCCSAAKSCGPGLSTVCCAGDGTCKRYTTTGGYACCPAAKTCGSACCSASQSCVGGKCQ